MMSSFKNFFTGAIVISLLSCPFSFATAQPTDKGQQTTIIIEMLSWHKNYIEKNYPNDSNTAYKKLAVRLFTCSLAYNVLRSNAKNDAEKNLMVISSDIYSRAALLLFAGSNDEMRNEFKKASEDLGRARDDRKKLFYLLRNCKDFSDPGNVNSALVELFKF